MEKHPFQPERAREILTITINPDELATLQKALRKIAYFESWADLPNDHKDRIAYESLGVKLGMKQRSGVTYDNIEPVQPS